MQREYLKIDNINGLFILITDAEGCFYGEVKHSDQATGEVKKGKVIKIDGTTITVQVFQPTAGLAAENSVTRLLVATPLRSQCPWTSWAVCLTGLVKPIDNGADIFSTIESIINGAHQPHGA